MIETTYKKQKIGEFLPNDETKSQDEFYLSKQQFLVQNKLERKRESSNSNKYDETSRKANICEKNVIYYKFNSSNGVENYEKLSWKWTMKNTNDGPPPDNDSSVVMFR